MHHEEKFNDLSTHVPKKKTRITMQNNPVMLPLTVTTDFLQEIMKKVIKPVNYLFTNWHWLFQKQRVQDNCIQSVSHANVSSANKHHYYYHSQYYLHTLIMANSQCLGFAKVNITDSCLCWRPLKKVLLLTQNYQANLMCP